jgi:hypothetical protein
MGVYRGAGELPREERLCRRAELAFGEALPADLGAPVIERARASLALTDREVAPAVDWHEAQRRQDTSIARRTVAPRRHAHGGATAMARARHRDVIG